MNETKSATNPPTPPDRLQALPMPQLICCSQAFMRLHVVATMHGCNLPSKVINVGMYVTITAAVYFRTHAHRYRSHVLP